MNQNHSPDASQIQKIERRLKDYVDKLHQLAPHYGGARQVKEFNSDIRKNALAAEQVRYIQRGESIGAAEALARSSPVYLEKFNQSATDLRNAEQVIADWSATMAGLTACQSLLAMSRESMRVLEG